MKRKQPKRPPFAALFLLTAAAIGGMRYYDTAVTAAVPTVTLVTVSCTDVEETVVCAGSVTAVEGEDVYVRIPCVVETVQVTLGERVQKGDVLWTVDRAATLATALGSGAATAVDTAALSALDDTVVAPADGVVSALPSAGDVLSPASPCAVIADEVGVEIAVVIRESTLPKVKVGQAVTVSGVAFDKSGYRGIITDIASSARSRVNGTAGETVVDAVVTLCEGEADDSLLVGLTAKATVTVNTHPDTLLVPYECLVQDDNGETAVYCRDGQTVRRQVIETAGEFAGGVAVAKGLSQGDCVVADPQVLVGSDVWNMTEAAS